MSKIIVWADLTKKQRNKILADHRLWLEGGGKGQRANLRDADLRYANLQGADLQRAYLQRANLQGADLRYAYLWGAYLQRAYLQRANLQGADLRYAYLWGANLQGADLQRANLRGANLRENLKIKAVYQCGPQGSRDNYLISFLCEDGKTYFSTGCQHGIERTAFLKLVAETHDGRTHGKQYKLAVAHCVKMLKLLVAE